MSRTKLSEIDLAWRKHLLSNKPKHPKSRTCNSCTLLNKPLWRAYHLQGTVLGATGDKKISEIVPCLLGTYNQMAELRHGFTETLMWDVPWKQYKTTGGERGLRKLGWILLGGRKVYTGLQCPFLIISSFTLLIFNSFFSDCFLYGSHQRIGGTEYSKH